MNVPVGDVIAVFRDVFSRNEGHAELLHNHTQVAAYSDGTIVGVGLTCGETRSNRCFLQSTGNTDISVLPAAPAWERFFW